MTNWRHDPRIKQLLEKETIETFFKKYFQSVCEKNEVQEMEEILRNALRKYDKKDELFEKLLENNVKEVEPLMQECLDSLCDKTKDHTPDNMLTWSKLFLKVADYRLACEVLWYTAELGIQEFIKTHQLKIKIRSHNGKRMFARELSDEIGNQFAVFECCHLSFYTNDHNADDVHAAFVQANDFVRKLRAYQITDEKRKELEKENLSVCQL